MTDSADELIAAQSLHLTSPIALGAHLDPKFKRGITHLEDLNDRIVAHVAPGDGRLMAHEPPRHGKSELCTKWTPTWFLALRPECNVGIACHTHDFAAEWGGKIRDIMAHNWPDLGIEVSHHSKAKYRWNTQQGGGLSAIGVGGTFIGKGFHVIVIDDPVKDGIEAMSETVQRKIWEWFKSSILTRLEPGGSIIIVQQRWHVDDLSGKLLQAQKDGPDAEGYDEWECVRASALSEGEAKDRFSRPKGTALWPGRFPAAKLERLKKSMGAYWFTAQYQQRPSPLGGDLIKELWWRYWVPKGLLEKFGPVVVDGIARPVVELPDDLLQFQSWDMNFRDSVRAIEEGKEPDDVSGQLWGFKGADKFLLDRIFGPFGLEETIHHVRDMSERWPKASTKLVEYAANGPAVIARLRHDVGGFRPVTPVGSKTLRVMGNPSAEQRDKDRGARAISMSVDCQGGNMYLPHPQLKTWAVEFRRNLGLFPKSGKDDTDACSQAWAFAQSPAWAEAERDHTEAVDELGGKAPVSDTREEFRRRMWDSVRREQELQGGRKPWR